MFRKLMGPAAVAVVLATSVAAQALTVTNRDPSEYTLTVAPTDDEEQSITIAANGAMDVPCAKGCSISIGDEEPMDLMGSESVHIEGGKLQVAE